MVLKDDQLLAVKGAVEAGKEILKIYDSADFSTDFKADNSPLTSADLASNKKILEYLNQSSFPIVSEETKMVTFDERTNWNTLWMVDPLDGTKEFIKRNGEFTVNIALIVHNEPVFGVIYVPVSRELYIGQVDKATSIKVVLNEEHELPNSFDTPGAQLTPQAPNSSRIRVVGSRSHMNQDTQDFIDNLKSDFEEIDIVSKGSSLKFCLVAEGLADVYPRYAPTMEWDTAAGQAICEAVGLEVISKDTGEPLRYNREDMLNGHFLVRHKSA
jgi:3'(2'), 5'-bisphosphate nucleotidase